MTSELNFRPAAPDEADLLGTLTLEGLYSWGHQENFPELMADFKENNLPTPDYIRREPVMVAEEDGNVIGFYGLHLPDEKDYVDLRYMFLETTYIGRGYGRKLWEHAVELARTFGRPRLRIVSDPAAVGFYAAMGATRERDHEVQPGFVLTIFWWDLEAEPNT